MSAEEAAPQPEPQPAGEDDPAPEEEVTAQWESKYKDLKEVKVESGEEEDDILFKMRCKLFHFLKAEEKYGGQMEWKEKGVGEPLSLSLSLPLSRTRCISARRAQLLALGVR
jgi:hypothetical protein|eukprot:COSAG02_NODE_1592_length_11779_cov_5.589640_5_plen_112_part_00